MSFGERKLVFEAVITLIVTASLLLGSPGPAPLALAATGATYGMKKGIPFLIGLLCGLVVAIIGATVGIAALFIVFPNVKLVFQIAGALYIVYIAKKIAMAPALGLSDKTQNSSPGLIDGFILNLINPKAYAALFAIFSHFLLPFQSNIVSFMATGAVCFMVAVFVDIVWLGLGGALRSIFETPKSERILRMTFAVLMIIAVLFAIFFNYK